MRDSMNDIVAGVILFLGMILLVGGFLLYISGSELPTRQIIMMGSCMVAGVLLYAQIRGESDDI